MHLTFSDWIGFVGVALLLMAFLLQLTGRITKEGLAYILMNITGAGLAGMASFLIHYIPFVVLEAVWTLISIIALLNYSR